MMNTKKSMRSISANTCDLCGLELSNIIIKIGNKEKKILKKCKCLIKKRNEELERIKAEEETNKFFYLFKQSKLGKRFEDSNFESIQITNINKTIITKMKALSNDFQSNKEKSYLMFSRCGTGKTLIVSATIKKLLEKNITSVFCVVPDLIADIKESWVNKKVATEAQIINGLSQCSVLVMDDICSESRKRNDDYIEELLFRIINNRYRSKKTTIFTSNLDIKELTAKLGNRTMSRILEMTGREHIFDMNKEQNFRTKKFINDIDCCN